MDNSGVHKSAQTIHFDQELDLSRFTKRGAPLRYRLMAAVHHRGTSEVGHYISVTRRDQDHWYSQDDDLVTKVSLNDALRPKEEFTPYLLFWAKIPTRKGLQTPLGSKERPHDEMGPPGQDETGQSQSKISSKKRSHEQAKDPTEGETGRPPSKSVKTINAPANTAKDTSRPDLTSPSRWPSNWLWGRSEVANKAQQAEQELSDCKEEHERKDELIKWYKDLMRRAAVTHSQLVASISFLNASYKESRRATDVIHPIMRNIHARGAKHEDKAGKFLELAERARDRRRRGKYHIHTSERLTRLVKPAIEDGLENEAFTAFTTAVEEAMGEDKLEFWLDNELTMSGLPVGDWRSQIRQ
ncbi:MAG: hypothetical protein LQ343_006755 [Gyalolechia ehrenbergii]|nr:MAG: hypothetical protein LQ343_006755 [Gyalolechia ehrenbergii]